MLLFFSIIGKWLCNGHGCSEERSQEEPPEAHLAGLFFFVNSLPMPSSVSAYRAPDPVTLQTLVALPLAILCRAGRQQRLRRRV
jgi:hypothetical protein